MGVHRARRFCEILASSVLPHFGLFVFGSVRGYLLATPLPVPADENSLPSPVPRLLGNTLRPASAALRFRTTNNMLKRFCCEPHFPHGLYRHL